MALKWHGWATKRGLAISKFLHLGFGFEEGSVTRNEAYDDARGRRLHVSHVYSTLGTSGVRYAPPREREKATTHYYLRKFDPSSARAVSSPGVARRLSFAPSASPRNAQPSVVSSSRTTPSQASSFAQ